MPRAGGEFKGLLIILWSLFPGIAFARTLQVPSQYPTIRSALSATVAGDIVEVSCGTYHEHDLQMRSGATLRSVTRDPSCVAIDADSLGRGLICEGAGADTRVEGLTLTNGFAGSGGGGMLCTGGAGPEIVNCVFEENITYTGGAAGLNIFECSPTVVNCVFQNNVGGGVTLWSSNGRFSNCRFRNEQGRGCFIQDGAPTFTDCEFSDIVGWWGGGAIYCRRGTLTMERCEFSGNTSDYGEGGAVFCESCQAAITKTTFMRNSGAIAVHGQQGSVTVTDSRFEHNEGCVTRMRGNVGNFVGCLFWDNHGPGGGVLNYMWETYDRVPVPASGLISHCTFAYNRPEFGGAVHSTESLPVLEDCIIAFQIDAAAVGCGPTAGAFPELTCCNVFGNEAGDWVDCITDEKDDHGNFSADPRFCDALNGDFRLSPDSPCLPGHHPHGTDCDLTGVYGVGCGATATQVGSWGAVKAMFR